MRPIVSVDIRVVRIKWIGYSQFPAFWSGWSSG